MPKLAKTISVGFDMDREAKFKLTMFKAELRARGIRASEVGVIEVLIAEAKIDTLARAYRRHKPDTIES